MTYSWAQIQNEWLKGESIEYSAKVAVKGFNIMGKYLPEVIDNCLFKRKRLLMTYLDPVL